MFIEVSAVSEFKMNGDSLVFSEIDDLDIFLSEGFPSSRTYMILDSDEIHIEKFLGDLRGVLTATPTLENER